MTPGTEDDLGACVKCGAILVIQDGRVRLATDEDMAALPAVRREALDASVFVAMAMNDDPPYSLN